jgi:outer membrane protein assembly factor BamB
MSSVSSQVDSGSCAAVSRPGPRWRLRIALGIIAGGAVLVGILQVFPGMDNAHRFLASAAATALTCFILLLFGIFGTGLRWPIRLVLLAAVIAAGVGIRQSVRIAGVTGDIWPTFTWRWSEKKDFDLVAQAAPSTGGQVFRKVDLTKTSAADFSQFLGRNRDNRVEGLELARDWSRVPPKKVWQQPIGAGWSAFSVVNDFAITQEQRGELEMVVCYELLTGKPCWIHSDRVRYNSVMGGDGPRATPTIVDGRVYTLGATGLLNCLDGATGKRIWSREIVQENGAKIPEWGKSCSPLVTDSLVIVSAGGPDNHSLVAYRKENGDLAWHAGDDKSSYASPVLTNLAGRQQVLIVDENSVMSHDPATGKPLWRFDWEGDQPKVPQPVPIDANRLFISAGYGLGSKLLEIKLDGEAWSVKVLWENRILKAKFANVCIRDGFVYGLDDGQALTCLELDTGKRKWKGRRYGHGQILLVGDLLVVQAESGDVALVEATPEGHHELSRMTVFDQKTWNPPALAGPYLLIRNNEQAACYELPTQKAETVARR